MPRPDPHRPREGQSALFGADPAASAPVGRHEAAVERTLAAARERGLIEDVDEALMTVIVAGGHSLDTFERQNQPYGPAKLIEPFVAALREARLTPDSRQTDTDDHIKDLLNDLAAADPAPTAPHPEDPVAADPRR